MKATDASNCPLCQHTQIAPFFEDTNRIYLRCSFCELVFVPKPYWLSLAEEKAVYDLHQNDLRDPGYRKFLSRLTKPLSKHLPANSLGLDFGCGPGPALAAMLTEAGYRVELYDPFYQHRPEVFSKSYDFICATEVVEHLRTPEQEFSTLFSLLKPGGWLGIMTKLVLDQESFSQWHYIRDPTHICFYGRRTCSYLAQRFSAELEIVGNDVILLHKH